MNIELAVGQLLIWDKASGKDLLNLLKSAVANAQNNLNLKEDNLYISEIKVNEGATLKRWRPRAHGRAFQILKRTCHIELTLNERKAKKSIENKEIKETADKKKDSEKKLNKKLIVTKAEVDKNNK